MQTVEYVANTDKKKIYSAKCIMTPSKPKVQNKQRELIFMSITFFYWKAISLQSSTASLSYKINHSHQTSLPRQVKVWKLNPSIMMAKLKGFYRITWFQRDGKSANSIENKWSFQHCKPNNKGWLPPSRNIKTETWLI